MRRRGGLERALVNRLRYCFAANASMVKDGQAKESKKLVTFYLNMTIGGLMFQHKVEVCINYLFFIQRRFRNRV